MSGAGLAKDVQHSSAHLPTLLSRFVGRERELAELTALLDAQRLVTLVGPGGCGKTRLALEAAQRSQHSFADGVFFIELAQLTTPTLLPQAVAAALGIHEQSGRALTETLIDALAHQHTLLILDNCEHLVLACAQFTETLLARCAHLVVLATSREALRIAGERVWPVPSLSLPEDTSVEQSDAVQLFLDRARATAHFDLAPEQIATLVHICRRLDGIPLAIELAAARMNLLSLEMLSQRLDDCLRALGSGSRTAVPRQQTLRAAIDWSYDLLSAQERSLFDRLSLFAGSFALPAVETVCADADLPTESILDLFARLRDQSLVLPIANAGGRFRLLEPIRQYAAQRLAAQPAHEALRKRHCVFYVSLAERLQPMLRSGQRSVALAELEADHDNLRAALAWAHDHGRADIGLRLVGALGWFWYFSGAISEGRLWIEQMLALPDAANQDRHLAYASWFAGGLSWVLGDYAAMRQQLQTSLQWYQQSADQRGVGYSLALIASMLPFGKAEESSERAITAMRADNDRWGLALVHYWRGDRCRVEGDLDAARRWYAESMLGYRSLNDSWGESLVLQGLGLVARRQNDLPLARQHLSAGLALRRKAGDRWLTAQTLLSLGMVALRQHDFETAKTAIEESLALYRALGERLQVVYALRSLSALADAEGDLVGAKDLLHEALSHAQALDDRWAIATCLEGAADLAGRVGQPVWVARLLGAAERLREGIASPWVGGERETNRSVQLVAQSALGAEAFASAWQAGREHDPAQIAAELILLFDQTSETATAQVVLQPKAFAALGSEPTWQLRIFGFGRGRVERDGREVSDWSYARVKELLFFLLEQGPRSKAQIGLAFWPDASPAQLRGNLHDALYHLRRALGDNAYVRYSAGGYTFDQSLSVWYDVQAFEGLIEQAQQLGASDLNGAIELMDKALRLYSGDFLSDLNDRDWHLSRQEALRRRYDDALLISGNWLAQAGRLHDAAERYRQAIAHDGYQETAHRALMRLYVQMGEPIQALRHYQNLVDWLSDELDSPPAPETTALFDQIRRDSH